MQHANFKQLVTDSWNFKQHYGCPMYTLSHKLKTLKATLKGWHLKSFPNVDEAVVLAHSKLAIIHEDISNNDLNGQHLKEKALANFEVA